LTLLSSTLDPIAVTAPRPPGRLRAHWVLTSASLVCFVLGQVLGSRAGVLATPLSIGGAAGCGFSWLLTRALFDPAPHDARWPRIVVPIVFLTGVVSILSGEAAGPVFRTIDNTHALGSSAVLLLTFVEPFNGYRRDLAVGEKRFRFAYLAVYTLLMGSSVLALNRSAAAGAERDFAELVKTICASAALLFCCVAVWFRARHPLAAKTRRVSSAEDAELAQRITRLLREEEIHVSPNLKVADLARRLGEPDYKVTRCITAALGFANVNRMLNAYRVERAKDMLRDPALRERSILLVALDCGFGSIGPFNRAFKDAVGMTPRAFRAGSSRGA
jgi:AraC-like DNA-binding protein